MKQIFALVVASVLVACSSPKQQSAPKPDAAPKYFKVDPLSAGKITVAVRFTGRRPPVKAISMNAEETCEKLHKKPVDGSGISIGKGGALANVFVYIKTGLEGNSFEPPKEVVVLDQRGCMFVPRVLALHTGQTLQVKNSDPVSHNIHPVPQNNREWNQQQAPGAPDLSRRFARPEVMIPIKCNVHSWMRSYIGVLAHPYFAVTNETGNFEWAVVPAGEYTVAAWHEAFGEITEQVKLGERQNAAINFRFSTPTAAKD
jgi:plastocyanin